MIASDIPDFSRMPGRCSNSDGAFFSRISARQIAAHPVPFPSIKYKERDSTRSLRGFLLRKWTFSTATPVCNVDQFEKSVGQLDVIPR
jgi:hypothetical protein